METVYIYATKADVLASQFFGRIADEPSQPVDYDDVPPQTKLGALFNKNPQKLMARVLDRKVQCH